MLKGMAPYYDQVTAFMPEMSAKAFANFTDQDGATPYGADAETWQEALALLFEHGAHMDVTEPLRQELSSVVARRDRKYIDLVAFTWFYATGEWPVPVVVKVEVKGLLEAADHAG